MKRHFMICVDNHNYETWLEIRKIYEMLTNRMAGKHHQIIVIDESGKDYLYPEKYFDPVRLPNDVIEFTTYKTLRFRRLNP